MDSFQPYANSCALLCSLLKECQINLFPILTLRELDHAMLRRLEKRILVGLPTKEARQKMIEHHLPPVISATGHGLQITTDLNYEHLATVSVVQHKM